MYEPGMFWAVFGGAWVLGFVIVCIVVWNLRSKQRMEKEKLIHEERLRAIEKGIPLPEFPTIDEEARMERFHQIFTPPKVNPRWPLGVGALCVMSGLGYMTAMLLSNDPFGAPWSMGMIGVFFGFGLFLYYFLTRQPEKPPRQD